MTQKGAIMSLIGASAFFLMLCLPFLIHYPMNDNSLQLYPVSLGIGVVAIVAFVFSFVKGNGFRFCLPDYLYLTLVAYYIIRYDYTLQLANWKVAFALLSIPLWFGSRIILSHRSVSKQWILGSIVAVGCLVAVWGLLQLYGYLPSNHNLFAITGPFYNPGPYSGYIAIIFCIALGCWLQSNGYMRYVWFTAMALMGCILPAGMSRSAWVGIFVSGLWMLSVHFQWYKRLKPFFKKHPYKCTLAITAFCVSLCIGGYSLFQMKSDSAYGRLFIWKNTCTAIADAPLFGYGPGSFPMVYGKVQAEYFAKGNYTKTEERVAGSPEYAFNEILQSGIEGGIVLIFLVGSVFVTTLKYSSNFQKTPFVGGVITLLFFSLGSYPTHILPFGLIAIVILTGFAPIENEEKRVRNSFLYSNRMFIMLGMSFIVYMIYISKHYVGKWENIELLHSTHSYKEASLGYKRLYNIFQT